MLGKIIDFERKGNVLRLYFGDKNLTDFTGNSWDLDDYKRWSGKVYDKYIIGHQDFFFDFDDLVLEPCEGYPHNVNKNDLKLGKIPAIIIVPKEVIDEDNDMSTCYYHWYKYDKTIKIYLGTVIEFENSVKHEPTIKLLETIKSKTFGTRLKYLTNLGFIANQKPTKRSTTGYKGVYKRSYGKYEARINVNKKEISVGIYDTLEEAVEARQKAVEKFYKPIICDAIQNGLFPLNDEEK